MPQVSFKKKKKTPLNKTFVNTHFTEGFGRGDREGGVIILKNPPLTFNFSVFSSCLFSSSFSLSFKGKIKKFIFYKLPKALAAT